MKGAVLYGPRDVRFEEREARKSRSRPTPSSASRRRAYAGLTCARIAAFNRLSSRPRWGMSIAASSRTWEARSNR
jgi:hypothetical protein